MKEENKTCEQVINDLNKKSGLLGLSQVSSDMREVDEARLNGNKNCELAMKKLCKSVANYIAMYNNMLNGADVITFTAGIGENSFHVRSEVIKLVASLGIKLDEDKNSKLFGEFGLISTSDSKIPVYVVPTNEELMIAQDTYDLINS